MGWGPPGSFNARTQPATSSPPPVPPVTTGEVSRRKSLSRAWCLFSATALSLSTYRMFMLWRDFNCTVCVKMIHFVTVIIRGKRNNCPLFSASHNYSRWSCRYIIVTRVYFGCDNYDNYTCYYSV